MRLLGGGVNLDTVLNVSIDCLSNYIEMYEKAFLGIDLYNGNVPYPEIAIENIYRKVSESKWINY